MTKAYRFLYRFVGFFMRLWHPGLQVFGRENVTDEGMIFCGNHASASDPLWFLLALKWPRMIRILAKNELRKVPFIGWLLKKLNVIFVRRGSSDVKAYRACVEALKADEKLLIFIEGTRCNHGKHAKPHSGAFRMAIQSGKPVIPVYIRRRRPFLCRMQVYFGKPEYVPAELKADKAAMDEYADAFLKKIYHLGGDTYAD